MASNEILTTSVILPKVLAEFSNKLHLLATANRATEQDFTQRAYRFGDTINLRQRNRSIDQNGQILSPQGITELPEPLTISYWPGRYIEFTSFDLSLKVDQFFERYMQPHVNSLANQCERLIAQGAALQLSNFVGSSSTPLNTFAAVDAARVRMLQRGVIDGYDAMMIMNPVDGGALRAALQNSFNVPLNTEISQHGALGRLGAFDIYDSQNLATQVAGSPGAGPITTTAIVASGNVIPMTGFPNSTLVFRAGDVFSVAGVKKINYGNNSSYGVDMSFVVLSDVTSTNTGTANVPVSPTIISDPANQMRNVSNPIPSGAVVTTIGSHNVNIAYTKNSLDIAMPKLDRLMVTDSSVQSDPDLHIALRLSIQGDIKSSVNGYRLDTLLGFRWHDYYTERVLSAASV